MRLRVYIFLLFVAPVSSIAGGFQVNLQSIRLNGMGHCGAGLAFDGSALFFNPGALSFVESNWSVTGGVNLVQALLSYQEPAPGTYTAANEKAFPTPLNLYSHLHLGDAITVGLGIYTPFGSTVRYADDWKGQFMLRELGLKTIFIQPTVSIKVTPKLGIGAGPVLAIGSVNLRKGVPAQFADGTYGEAELAGSGTGYGFNAGVYIDYLKRLPIGLSFRSPVKFIADGGDATFNVPQDLTQYFPTTTFRSEIVLPWTASLNVTWVDRDQQSLDADDIGDKPQGPNEPFRISAEVNLVGWSVYDTLSFDFAENTDKLADNHSPREYKNAFIFRIGAEKVFERFMVRGGFYIDGTPVQAGYLTPETPDAMKLGFTGGFSWMPFGDERLRVDASMIWVEGLKRTDTNIETQFSGTWKGRAFVPGIGLCWQRLPTPDRRR